MKTYRLQKLSTAGFRYLLGERPGKAILEPALAEAAAHLESLVKSNPDISDDNWKHLVRTGQLRDIFRWPPEAYERLDYNLHDMTPDLLGYLAEGTPVAILMQEEIERRVSRGRALIDEIEEALVTR